MKGRGGRMEREIISLKTAHIGLQRLFEKGAKWVGTRVEQEVAQLYDVWMIAGKSRKGRYE